jgi:hypothetical protein
LAFLFIQGGMIDMNKARLRKLTARENRQASKNARLPRVSQGPVPKKIESKGTPEIVKSTDGSRKMRKAVDASIQVENMNGTKENSRIHKGVLK